MQLQLIRDTLLIDRTLGRLVEVYPDGTTRWLAETLEDEVRPADAPKVAGATAIPVGTYPLAITPSPRFKRLLIEVQQVPGFTGIRIHPGNSPEDTAGCILVGMARTADHQLFRSQDACAHVQAEVAAGLARRESVTLTIALPDPQLAITPTL